MLAAVVDTNIFISGLLKDSGPTNNVLTALSNNTFELITSHNLLKELIFTLEKPKLSAFINPDRSARLVSFIKRSAVFVELKIRLEVCRDDKDNKFLECAVEGKADCIVTGDKDLLVLNPFRGIDIITPSEFLKILKK